MVALQELTAAQAKRVARIAKAARVVQEASFGTVPQQDFGEPIPAHGERDPSRTPEIDSLPIDAPQVRELRQTVIALAPSARRELFMLMRIGKGDYAIGDWDRGLADANLLDDEAIAGAITEDGDLHDHVMKALYEAGRT